MLMKINKNTGSRKDVKYAALSSGTISHVWYDEDSSALSAQKRTNRIRLTREKVAIIEASKNYDA